MSYFRADEQLESGSSRPQPPWNVVIAASYPDGTLELVWNMAYGRCDGYVILGGTAQDDLHEIARIPSNTIRRYSIRQTDIHKLAQQGTACYLAVAAVAGNECSAPSNIVTVPVVRHRSEQQVQQPAQPAMLTNWEQIDQALQRNTAVLGRNGLFLHQQRNEAEPRDEYR